MQGYEAITLTSTIRANSHTPHLCRHFFNVSYAYQRLVRVPAFSTSHRLNHRSYTLSNVFRGRPSLASSIFGGRGFYFNHKQAQMKRFRIYAALDVASAVDVINDLGLDTLTFLGVTVMIVPAFKIIKASPVSLALAFWKLMVLGLLCRPETVCTYTSVCVFVIVYVYALTLFLIYRIRYVFNLYGIQLNNWIRIDLITFISLLSSCHINWDAN